jgi:hypothetical protein
MRCTQLRGLTPEATKFLDENSKIVVRSKCPHCDGVLSEGIESKVYADATSEGMFDDGPMLHQYTLKDGKIVKEIVQATVWSSGPCIFLCLENEEGNQLFPWPPRAIAHA